MSTAADQLRAKLQVAIAQQSSLPTVRAQVEALRSGLAHQRATLGRLAAAASVEQEELDRWSGNGFGPLLLRLLGRLDDRLERERDQAGRAAAQLASQQVSVDAMTARLDAALARQADAERGAQAVPMLIAELRAVLALHDPQQMDGLVQREQAAAVATTEIAETNEAIMAVDVALGLAGSAAGELDTANGWANWDLFGGGMMSSMIKNGHVDSALEHAHQLNDALKRVRFELSQVHAPVDVPDGLEHGSAARTLDVWFDNVFSDWTSKERIVTMQTSLAAVRSELAALRSHLAEHLRTSEWRRAESERALTAFAVGDQTSRSADSSVSRAIPKSQ